VVTAAPVVMPIVAFAPSSRVCPSVVMLPVPGRRNAVRDAYYWISHVLKSVYEEGWTGRWHRAATASRCGGRGAAENDDLQERPHSEATTEVAST
jgi:hypothetical protein